MIGPICNFNWRFINDAGGDVVGWPNPVTVPGTRLWPYQQMTALIPEIRSALFAAILLPPCTTGAAGVYSAGYDLYDPYDLDGTAFGTAEMLRELVAVAHAHGIAVYGDLVLHQYDGGEGGVYPTKRWPKSPSCFSGIEGGVEADSVPDETGNFAFGVLAAYVKGRYLPTDPPGYMHDGAIANAQWLTRTIGLDGWRIDDAKGTNAQVVYDLTHAEGMESLFFVAEYFDGNPAAVGNYVDGYEKRRMSVLDFALKFNAGNICNNNSRVWMGQCANLGWCDVDPFTAVTFCESADTDTSPGEQTIWNKTEGYAIMHAKQGVPMTYWRDFAEADLCYGLAPTIVNLVWIWWMLCQGDMVVRLDDDPQVFACERLGTALSPGCLFVVNNDQYSGFTRRIATHFGPNVRMHGYSTTSPYDDLWTAEDGSLTVTVPPNDNGFGYLFYGPAGIEGGPDLPPMETKQTLFGAADLINSPAMLPEGTMQLGQVSAKAGTLLSATLTPDQTGWGNEVQILINIYDPAGTLVGDINYDDQGETVRQGYTITVFRAGWHTFTATTSGLPAAGSAYALEVIYTGIAA